MKMPWSQTTQDTNVRCADEESADVKLHEEALEYDGRFNVGYTSTKFIIAAGLTARLNTVANTVAMRMQQGPLPAHYHGCLNAMKDYGLQHINYDIRGLQVP